MSQGVAAARQAATAAVTEPAAHATVSSDLGSSDFAAIDRAIAAARDNLLGRQTA